VTPSLRQRDMPAINANAGDNLRSTVPAIAAAIGN
jgi:hypothetical protein